MIKKILLCGYSGYPKIIRDLIIDKDSLYYKLFMLDNLDLDISKLDVIMDDDVDWDNLKDNYIFLEEPENGYQPLIVVYKKDIFQMMICDIDISRPWTLVESGFTYRIKYLDEKKLVDEELNYYK